MAAGLYDFTIEQGATFQIDLTWKDQSLDPVDITGYTARMQIRASVTDPTVLLELTTEDGLIILGTTDGKITLFLDAVTTAAITWDRGVYDLELVSPTGYVTRLLKGNITIDKEVTR